MAAKRMDPKDVGHLLAQYRSERKRLIYQLERVREAIADLKKTGAGKVTGSEDENVVKRGPGRPKKDPSEKKSTYKKVGRRKKREIKDGGYRLNAWDQLVVDTVTNADKLITKEQLFTAAKAWAKQNEPSMSDKEIEDKLTRVLQKLSGKRKILGTHRTGMIRGYHYGLMKWFFESSGKLRKQHFERIDYRDTPK